MFESISLNNITLKNAFLRSGTSERVSFKGAPDIEMLSTMYRNLAQGEAGTIITGFCFVSPEGQSSPTQNGLHEDALIPVWQKVIEKSLAREFNTTIYAQLVHGGRQVFFPTELPHLIPTDIPVPLSENKGKIMDKKDIAAVRKAFVRAVDRAVEAGFEGVQIHCAHGYLINEFLSPATNKRTDEYGGNTKNRARFLIEVLDAIRDKFPELPMSMKINGCDYIENGLSPEETSGIISLVKEHSLDFYEVSGWMWQGNDSKAPSRKVDPKIPEEEGYYYQETLKLQQDHPNETFALCGGVRSTDFCHKVKKDFKLISMCRPFISQPDLISLFRNSKITRSRCISCNLCVTQGPPQGLICTYFNDKREKSLV